MLKQKCPFFGLCGGCLWQGLPEAEYLSKKEIFIRRAFADAGLTEIPLKPIILLPTGIRRRASFAFYQGHFGFNEARSHKIVEVDACPLLVPKINALIPKLRTLVQQLGGAGDCFVLKTDAGVDVHIKDGKGLPDLKRLEILGTLAVNPDVVRLMYNNTPIFEKMPLIYQADTFLQPSAEGEKALVDLVLKNVGPAKRAVDLFCGYGTFTRPLVGAGISVVGYDADARSVSTLGPMGIQRDLFRNPLTASELTEFDLAVLDPPRAGAKEQVLQLTETKIPRIIMVSCAPKTGARDIKILMDAGWHLTEITPVDQFTYSNHIEIVAALEKSA
ncbi:MAG: class I SAM-dependent RNA methyltransferase [Alphaproteobacteria bacterium]